MGKSKELAELTDTGFIDNAVVKSGKELRVYRPDNATYGGISHGAAGTGIVYNDLNGDGHHFQFNGTTQMNIDASGRVTMPYQPAMFITGNWNTYQAPDSATRARFNHVKGGNSGGFDTSTHTFTAPAAGKYFMSVYALVQSSANWEFQFYKNGSYYARCYTQGDRTTSGHVIMDMAVNDYASIVCASSIYLHTTDTYSGWTIVKVA